jgi:hypothetical protein
VTALTMPASNSVHVITNKENSFVNESNSVISNADIHFIDAHIYTSKSMRIFQFYSFEMKVSVHISATSLTKQTVHDITL